MSSSIMLLEAARNSNVEVLERLLKENPSILTDFRLISLEESLLHIATKSGQCNFVHKLMSVDPAIAQEMSKDGFRALDIAVIMGNLGIVKEILNFNEELCLLRGKDQGIALHYAAIKGRLAVIDALLDMCPDSIECTTIYGETALHLAMKAYQFDAFSSLVKWLKKLNKEAVVNKGDGDGDTLLHLAVSTRQYEYLDLLIGKNSTIKGEIEVNAKNAKGLTALDVLDMQDAYSTKIYQVLESAGAVRAPDSARVADKKSNKFQKNHVLQPLPSKNWFKYFKFQKGRDSPSDTRNTLLVVAALITTVCFQAGITPPNGILDKPPQPNNTTIPNTRQGPFAGPVEGSVLAAASAVFGSHASSFLFLFANSLGITASQCIIIYLTSGFPFQRELHIALYSMMFTYGFAISTIIKGIDAKKKIIAYTLLTTAFVLPFAQRWLPHWGKRAWNQIKKRDVTKSPLPVNN